MIKAGFLSLLQFCVSSSHMNLQFSYSFLQQYLHYLQYNILTMADVFGSNNDSFDLGGSGNSDKLNAEEIQRVIMMEQQKAHLNAQIQEISEICWEKCVDKPSAKLGGKTEVCLTNCVKRFFDTSVIIAHRFNQLLQRSNSG